MYVSQYKIKAGGGQLGGGGLWVDKRVNPGGSDWCLKMLPCVDELKTSRAKRDVNEWSSASLFARTQSLSKVIGQFAAPEEGVNVVVASHWMEMMQQLKVRHPPPPAPPSSCETVKGCRSFTQVSRAEGRSQRRPTQRGRRRESESGAGDHHVSPPPFCLPLIPTRYTFSGDKMAVTWSLRWSEYFLRMSQNWCVFACQLVCVCEPSQQLCVLKPFQGEFLYLELILNENISLRLCSKNTHSVSHCETRYYTWNKMNCKHL